MVPYSAARQGVAVVVALAWLVAASSHALAGEPTPSDKETSRTLYGEGMRLLDARDYVRAERACRGAHALVKAPTSATCWAQALEGLGQLTEARDAFLEAARYPVLPGEPPVFTSARESARAEADRLAPRIPTLLLVVAGPGEAMPLRVAIDGVPVPRDVVRLPRKVDPGRHLLVVGAAGFRRVRTEVVVAESEERRIDLELQPLPDGSPDEPVSTSAFAGDRSGGWKVPSALSYAAFGAGAVGLVVGVATGVAAGSKHAALDGECSANGACAPAAQGDLDQFHALRTASTIAYVVGLAGVAGGVVLWWTAPAPSGRSVRAWVGPSSLGVTGAF